MAYSFNNFFKQIIVNDILESNFYAYNVWFSSDYYDEVKIDKLINEYNKNRVFNENYFSVMFADTYFSVKDCMLIGYIREDIENKYNSGLINLREKYILITALIYSMDRIANTVGHYDAYRKSKNLLDSFVMFKLKIPDNTVNKYNEIYNNDANILVKDVMADIVYIDPPYNSRQYSDTYHLLENIARWDKPEVYGLAKKMDRTHIKSCYCTNKAGKYFFDLIENIKGKYILISYNNMGTKGDIRSNAKISDNEILEALRKKGKVNIFEKTFDYFTAGKTNLVDHKERIFFCEVEKKMQKLNKIRAESESYIKSPLNYNGGKYNLLNQIIPFLPGRINNFIDMFCGGCNVGINVQAENHIFVDKQGELINIIKVFKENSSEYIIEIIEYIIEKYSLSNSFLNSYKYYKCESSNGLGMYNKINYLKLRDDYNRMDKNDRYKSFYLMTLIIYGFNNQIRFNNKGLFNVPVGKRDFNGSIRSNIISFSERIKAINSNFQIKF